MLKQLYIKNFTLIDEPITPDGKLDEAAWADGSFTELLVGQDNATELKASIGLLADKTALYLAAKVTDSELSNDLVPGVDFAADMVELYLDGLNLESSAYDASTVQFQFRWNDEKLWIYGNSKTFDNTKFAMVATDDGYVLEVVIPWADLGIEFNPDHTIGLTADVQDYDSSTKEYKSVAMIEGAGFWNNSSAWESYGFKEKSSPEESVITPSKPAASGWQKASDGSWSYYRSGKRVTGWLLDNGYWYHLDKDGIMDTGWLTDNGSTYYLRSWGGMIVGWFKLNDTWYFADRSGAVKDLFRKSGLSRIYMSQNAYTNTFFQFLFLQSARLDRTVTSLMPLSLIIAKFPAACNVKKTPVCATCGAFVTVHG